MKMYLILQADSSKFSRYQWTKFIWFLKIFRKIMHIKNTDNQSMQWKPLNNKILSYPFYMMNWNKTIRSMLLRRTRLSKSLSIDNTGLNWWLTWKWIQLQVGVWIFFVDSSQTHRGKAAPPPQQQCVCSNSLQRQQRFPKQFFILVFIIFALSKV